MLTVIRTKLLEAGVKNLKEFGYPDVTTANILTEYIYAKFFERMLDDNLGKSTKQVDSVITALKNEVAENIKVAEAKMDEEVTVKKPKIKAKTDRRKKARE